MATARQLPLIVSVHDHVSGPGLKFETRTPTLSAVYSEEKGVYQTLRASENFTF